MTEKAYWDATDPLKPVEDESSLSNGALNDYARMGYNRSLRKLYELYQDKSTAGMDVPTTNMGTLGAWSVKYDWQDRVSAWTELERKRTENEWRERRDSLRSKEWTNYERLQDIVSEMLETIPQFIKRKEAIVDKGTPTVILKSGEVVKQGTPEKRVITLKADAGSIVQFVKVASSIGRQAAEMDQAWMSRLMREINFDKLDNEQVARLADGEHILDVLGIRK